MDSEDLHYLGGVIDGDGSIYISVEKSNEERRGFKYRIRPRFRVEMKDVGTTTNVLSLLCELAEEEDIHYNEKRTKRGTWRFEVSGTKNTVSYLELLEPYVRGKSLQLEELIQAPWYESGEWFQMNKSERQQRFIEIMEVRENIREVNANRESKYDVEYFEQEVFA